MIGIVGGAGPLAGNDLFYKIIEETAALSDQEHLPVLLWSDPTKIPDRTEFLEGKVKQNPAVPITEIFLKLERNGARVGAIPCNTAHAPVIFEEIRTGLQKVGSQLQLISIIEETVRYLAQQYPSGTPVGVLSTTGTWKRRIYADPLEAAGFEVLTPEAEEQSLVHQAIYHKGFGVKASGTQITGKAKEILYGQADTLIDQGAEVVILGCTEIPLVIREAFYRQKRMVDTVRVLARALIKAYAPDKLKH